MLVLSGAASPPHASSQTRDSSHSPTAGLTLHPEIYITDNSQFTPGNGVTGGNGTRVNPYVIQGWEMDASTTSTAGIDIRYTSAYFVIRDVYVHGVTDGIDFLYVVHGRIENTTTANNFNGITLSSSVADVIDNNTVSGNQEGITIDNSQYVDCYNNTVVGTASQGITLGGYSTSHVNVTGNQLRWNSWALVVTGVKNSTVSPYQTDLLDRDNYPLMKPFGPQLRFAPTWPAESLLTASNITPTTITLSWTPAIGAIKYRVYEFPVPITNVSSTSFTVTGLRIGATYSFKVEAGDGWSNFTTNGPGLTVRIIPPGAYLGYVAFYFGSNYQGGSTLIVNNFTDLGQNAVRVTSVTMTGELGR